MLTKAELHQSATRWAQGGVAAVLSSETSALRADIESDSTDLLLAEIFSAAVLPLAFSAGLLLQAAYPGDFGYTFQGGGPALASWVAALGGAAALVAAPFIRRLVEPLERRGLITAVPVTIPDDVLAAHGQNREALGPITHEWRLTEAGRALAVSAKP